MMKSLEIVNERIESLKYYIDNSERIYYSFYSLIDDLNEMEKIKQDLEVLEILRKHIYLRRFENMNRNEVVISPLISESERDKLKQWLEDNDEKNV